MELAFTLSLSRAAGAVLGGALALALNPMQMVLMTWVVAGPEAVRAAVAASRAAADRLFGLLPPDQAARYRALWDEFEAAETDDCNLGHAPDSSAEPGLTRPSRPLRRAASLSPGTDGQGRWRR